jgi:Zn-finger nucleic acid-binding protein
MFCPNCNCSDCWRDEVDIGVGVQYGPWHCPECGWYEGHEVDAVIDAERASVEDNPDYDCGPSYPR